MSVEGFVHLKNRIVDLEKTTAEQAQRIRDLESDLYVLREEDVDVKFAIINDRLDQHARAHREISGEGYARDVSWLLVVRKNGARFKIRAKDLPHVVLYNGDRLERTTEW